MASGSAIRGSKMGSSSVGRTENVEPISRLSVSYYCASGHITRIVFAQEACVPNDWECPKCGLPANLDSHNPPPRPNYVPYKTPLDYAKERRSADEAKLILSNALQELRARRASGEVIY